MGIKNELQNKKECSMWEKNNLKKYHTYKKCNIDNIKKTFIFIKYNKNTKVKFLIYFT